MKRVSKKLKKPTNSKSKGWATKHKTAFLAFIFVLLLGFIYLLNRNNPQGKIVKNVMPSVSPSSTQETKNLNPTFFQKILAESCIKTNVSYVENLANESNLPFSYNKNLDFNSENNFQCEAFNNVRLLFKGNKYFGDGLIVYDKQSSDLNRQGPSPLLLVGKSIYENGDTKLRLYLDWPEVPDLPSKLSTLIKGERELTLSNGEKVNIEVKEIVFTPEDQDYQNFMKSFDEKKEYASNVIESAIAEKYFNQSVDYNSQAKKHFQHVLDLLNSFTSR